MPVGNALHVGQVVSYDAGLRQWQIDFPTLSATPTNFGADDMARYGPPNTTCPPQPGTSEHTIAAYLRGRAPGPAWFASAPMISPYRRRLWAKLSTNSDFAICRGKRGCVAHQACSCTAGTQAHALEDTAHVCFECEYYTTTRPPLLAAAQKWCRETGTPPGKAGLASAIHWAATNCMPPGAATHCQDAGRTCRCRRGRPPKQRRCLLRQGHVHPIQQIQDQLGHEHGRCPSASRRSLDLECPSQSAAL